MANRTGLIKVDVVCDLVEQFKRAGLLPDDCTQITIIIKINEYVKISYECLADQRLAEINWQQAFNAYALKVASDDDDRRSETDD